MFVCVSCAFSFGSCSFLLVYLSCSVLVCLSDCLLVCLLSKEMLWIWFGGEHQEGVGGGETVIRIYSLKKTLKRKRPYPWATNEVQVS